MPPSHHDPSQVDRVPDSFGLSGESDAWMDRVREAEAPSTLGCIGRYELIEEVSRGGQGIVYRARQPGTKREIVVKRLLAGSFATPVMLRRFEREVELAASLSHPNIVTVFGIEIVDGQPLLAMEWIDGVPIDEWAASGEAGRPSPKQIAAMMHEVCGAVHHAHQHGIIHRDLKPSNILVDQNGVPRVLDFGLARPVDAEADGGQTVTLTEQFVGTPAYASPEHLRGGTGATDVRADVYSLGLILYQSLTGRFPYDVNGDLPDVFHRIEHAEPVRPSSAAPRVDREIEAIVLKALAKEKERRYQSADLLAEDLRRYVHGEPVSAHPPSTFYQLQKLAKRHRGVVFGASVASLTLVLGIAATTWQAARATAQRDRALEAERIAAKGAASARHVSAFLQELLASANPQEAGRTDVTVREVLDNAAARVDTELAQQPEVAAEAHETLGRTYLEIGQHEKAEKHLQTARELFVTLSGDEHGTVARCDGGLAILRAAQGRLPEAQELYESSIATLRAAAGETDPVLAQSLNDFGKLLAVQGDYDAADAAIREALDIRTRHFGENNPHVANSVDELAQLHRNKGDYRKAEPLFREALQIRQQTLGASHPDVAASMNNLGVFLRESGDQEAAGELLTNALALRRQIYHDRHPLIALSLNNLAAWYRDNGRDDEAVAAFREALAIRREVYGPEHLEVATSLNGLGLILTEQGKLDEAEPLLREALAIRRRQLGDHVRVATSLNNLMILLQRRGDPDGAELTAREALELRRRIFDGDHPSTATSLNNLGYMLLKKGELGEAEEHLRAALAMRRAVLGDDHPRVATTLINLAKVLSKTKDFDEAEACLRKAIGIKRSQPHGSRMQIAVALRTLGALLNRRGQYAAAETPLVEALAICEESLPAAHPNIVACHLSLARAKRGQGDLPQAERLLRAAVAMRRQWHGSDNRSVALSLLELASVLQEAGKPEAAEPLPQEALPIARASAENDDWLPAQVRSVLGECLALQERYEEAEPLLVEAYESLKATSSEDQERATTALLRIIDLYEAWSKPDRADQYRAPLPQER